jgi:hypothetical protein
MLRTTSLIRERQSAVGKVQEVYLLSALSVVQAGRVPPPGRPCPCLPGARRTDNKGSGTALNPNLKDNTNGQANQPRGQQPARLGGPTIGGRPQQSRYAIEKMTAHLPDAWRARYAGSPFPWPTHDPGNRRWLASVILIMRSMRACSPSSMRDAAARSSRDFLAGFPRNLHKPGLPHHVCKAPARTNTMGPDILRVRPRLPRSSSSKRNAN